MRRRWHTLLAGSALATIVGCGQTFLSKTNHGPAVEAPHQHRAHHLEPRGAIVDRDRSGEHGGSSIDVVDGGVPRLELAPTAAEAWERQRTLDAGAEASTEVRPVRGADLQSFAELDGDLARIETELAVVGRAQTAAAAVPDARATLAAAREAARVAPPTGAGPQAAELVHESARFATAVEAGDASGARTAAAAVLKADADVRAAANLPR